MTTDAGATSARRARLPARVRRMALAGLCAIAGGSALSGAVAVAATAACDAPAGFEPRARVESDGTVVLYRTVPATIEIGQHFAVEAVLCPALPPDAAAGVRVDARMPEHRHGMNYRPRITRKDARTWVAEGLLFHMPGLWQLTFDIERGGRVEHLSADIDLE
jgi:hypothetical protein